MEEGQLSLLGQDCVLKLLTGIAYWGMHLGD